MRTSGVPWVLRYVRPNWFTSTGMLGSACATRFWALTWSALRSVPTSNVTRTVIVPSFAFTDWR